MDIIELIMFVNWVSVAVLSRSLTINVLLARSSTGVYSTKSLSSYWISKVLKGEIFYKFYSNLKKWLNFSSKFLKKFPKKNCFKDVCTIDTRNIHQWWAEWAVADWDSGAEAGAGMLAWRHCSGVSSVHWWPLNTQCQLSPEHSAVNIFQISHTQYTCDCYQWCCIRWWWWVDESEEWHLMNQS